MEHAASLPHGHRGKTDRNCDERAARVACLIRKGSLALSHACIPFGHPVQNLDSHVVSRVQASSSTECKSGAVPRAQPCPRGYYMTTHCILTNDLVFAFDARMACASSAK